MNDFVELAGRLAPVLSEQPGLRVVTNAGGLNPLACVYRCARALCDSGLGTLPVAAATGDDLLARVPEMLNDGVELAHFETGEPIGSIVDRLVSFNVYLGAKPISAALGAAHGSSRLDASPTLRFCSDQPSFFSTGGGTIGTSWPWQAWLAI